MTHIPTTRRNRVIRTIMPGMMRTVITIAITVPQRLRGYSFKFLLSILLSVTNIPFAKKLNYFSNYATSTFVDNETTRCMCLNCKAINYCN
ncbi:hypothetical protein PUN28_013570 [Cardiocondyla obscurior]|uniref:Uncharacterized protein n=1 Tax=Cardiocondyla obscurior TaxID=286306 RepID=A0AAW2F482_9HYME